MSNCVWHFDFIRHSVRCDECMCELRMSDVANLKKHLDAGGDYEDAPVNYQDILEHLDTMPLCSKGKACCRGLDIG